MADHGLRVNLSGEMLCKQYLGICNKNSNFVFCQG